MFWKLVALALVIFAVAMYFDVRLGGLVYALPLGALVAVVIRRVSRDPDSEFGRWRSAQDRRNR